MTPAAPATTTPTGNVQFYANGTPLGGLVALNSGAASISTASLPAGSNTVTAAYAGDGNFYGSTNSLVQVVSVIAQTPITVGMAVAGDGTVTVTFQGTPGAQYLVQAVSGLGQSAGLGERLDQHRRAGWAVDLHRIGGGPCPALLPLGQTLSDLTNLIEL